MCSHYRLIEVTSFAHATSTRAKARLLLWSNFDFYYEKFLVLMEYALWGGHYCRSSKGDSFVLILVLMEVSTYPVEVLLKSLHLLRNRIPRQGATIAMKQLRFLLRKIPCCNGICSMSARRSIWCWIITSLNPCCNGSINLFSWSLIEVASFATQPHSAQRRDYWYEATSIFTTKNSLL